MRKSRWEWALPSGALALITAAAATEWSGDGYDPQRSVGAIIMLIFAGTLLGAWLVLIGATHRSDGGKKDK